MFHRLILKFPLKIQRIPKPKEHLLPVQFTNSLQKSQKESTHVSLEGCQLISSVYPLRTFFLFHTLKYAYLKARLVHTFVVGIHS